MRNFLHTWRLQYGMCWRTPHPPLRYILGPLALIVSVVMATVAILYVERLQVAVEDAEFNDLLRWSYHNAIVTCLNHGSFVLEYEDGTEEAFECRANSLGSL